MCGERTGAVVLWQPSHHPSGCCTLVVVEESNYIRREGFLQTQTNHSTCGLRRIDFGEVHVRYGAGYGMACASLRRLRCRFDAEV